jgi:hypothetical protein
MASAGATRQLLSLFTLADKTRHYRSHMPLPNNRQFRKLLIGQRNDIQFELFCRYINAAGFGHYLARAGLSAAAEQTQRQPKRKKQRDETATDQYLHSNDLLKTET